MTHRAYGPYALCVLPISPPRRLRTKVVSSSDDELDDSDNEIVKQYWLQQMYEDGGAQAATQFWLTCVHEPVQEILHFSARKDAFAYCSISSFRNVSEEGRCDLCRESRALCGSARFAYAMHKVALPQRFCAECMDRVAFAKKFSEFPIALATPSHDEAYDAYNTLLQKLHEHRYYA